MDAALWALHEELCDQCEGQELLTSVCSKVYSNILYVEKKNI